MNRTDRYYIIQSGLAFAFTTLIVLCFVGLVGAWLFVVISSAIANGYLWAVLAVAGVLITAFITGAIYAWKGTK